MESHIKFIQFEGFEEFPLMFITTENWQLCVAKGRRTRTQIQRNFSLNCFDISRVLSKPK